MTRLRDRDDENADRQEAYEIARGDYDQLGHRVVYDAHTGWSRNIWGVWCDPTKLNAAGYQVRL